MLKKLPKGEHPAHAMTKEEMLQNVQDPKNLDFYHRAVNLWNRMFGNALGGAQVNANFKQKGEPYSVYDNRMIPALFNPDRTMAENSESMNTVSYVENTAQLGKSNYESEYVKHGTANITSSATKAANLRSMLDGLMKSDLSGLASMDPEDVLSAMENSPNHSAVMILGQFDSTFGKLPCNENGELNYDAFKKTYGSLMQSPENPNGLTNEEVDFLVENVPMFAMFSSFASRLGDYANPKGPILGYDLNQHYSMNKYQSTIGAEREGPYNAVFDRQYGNPTFIADFTARYAMEKGAEGSIDHMAHLLLHDKERDQKGYLMADYSAYRDNGDGTRTRINKQVALEEMYKGNKNISFELNEFGKRMKPERDAERSIAQNYLATANDLRAELKNIYTEGWNASPEFHALAAAAKKFQTMAEAESKKFVPNNAKLSRSFHEMQQLAEHYQNAKKGQKVNDLRGKRLDFAEKLKTMDDPMSAKNMIKEMKSKIAQQQERLHDAIELYATNPEQAEKDMRSCMAHMMAYKANMAEAETARKAGQPLSQERVQEMRNPGKVAELVTNIAESDAFKQLTKEADFFTPKNMKAYAADKYALVHPTTKLDGAYQQMTMFDPDRKASNEKLKPELLKSLQERNEQVRKEMADLLNEVAQGKKTAKEQAGAIRMNLAKQKTIDNYTKNYDVYADNLYSSELVKMVRDDHAFISAAQKVADSRPMKRVAQTALKQIQKNPETSAEPYSVGSLTQFAADGDPAKSAERLNTMLNYEISREKVVDAHYRGGEVESARYRTNEEAAHTKDAQIDGEDALWLKEKNLASFVERIDADREKARKTEVDQLVRDGKLQPEQVEQKLDELRGRDAERLEQMKNSDAYKNQSTQEMKDLKAEMDARAFLQQRDAPRAKARQEKIDKLLKDGKLQPEQVDEKMKELREADAKRAKNSTANMHSRNQRNLRKEGWTQEAQSTFDRYKADFAKDNADVKARPGSKDTNSLAPASKKTKVM